jgi:hypothetical protein
MEKRRRSILGFTTLLPVLAVSAYLLGIPADSSALACQRPDECTLNGQCYSRGACVFPGCSDGRGQVCGSSPGSSIPAWIPCAC